MPTTPEKAAANVAAWRARQSARMRAEAECVAQLAWGPKTTRQLVDATGLTINDLRDFLAQLVDAGMAYVAGHAAVTEAGGRPPARWALQPWPFARDGRPCPVSAPAPRRDTP